MSFSVIQTTSQGRALLARAQTGTIINFTHIKMGNGEMTSQVIDDMTDVISQKANLSITQMKVLTIGKAKVQATFSNSGLAAGFYWREIAVFATDPNNAGAEIMYCYGNAGALADYIPAEGSQFLERVISVLTIISNATNVTATIDSSNVYVTTQDADASYVKKSIATAASQFLVSSAVGTWVVKTIAEIKSLLGLGSAAYTDSTAYATAAQGNTSDNTATLVSSHLSDIAAHATKADITFYVDAENGLDTNNGVTSGTAFKTIQKAVNMLPKNINHLVTINVAAGTYLEDVLVTGFSGSRYILFSGAASLADTHQVDSFIAMNIICYVVIVGFKLINTNASCFSATRCLGIDINYCRLINASSFPGVTYSTSFGSVWNCEISNRQSAIMSSMFSSINSKTNTGISNTYGLLASKGGAIIKDGTQPSGITAEYTEIGGVIK